MRDLIWTIIVIWLTWQVVNIFRSNTAKRQRPGFEGPPNPQPRPTSERQRKLDTEGEYVDFEESK